MFHCIIPYYSHIPICSIPSYYSHIFRCFPLYFQCFPICSIRCIVFTLFSNVFYCTSISIIFAYVPLYSHYFPINIKWSGKPSSISSRLPRSKLSHRRRMRRLELLNAWEFRFEDLQAACDGAAGQRWLRDLMGLTTKWWVFTGSKSLNPSKWWIFKTKSLFLNWSNSATDNARYKLLLTVMGSLIFTPWCTACILRTYMSFRKDLGRLGEMDLPWFTLGFGPISLKSG
jgi:hypothetical protein